MKIEFHPKENFPSKCLSIEEFADEFELTMEVHERSSVPGPSRYYAHFKRCEIKEGGFLIGASGDGDTVEVAIANYAKRISGRLLIINAYGTDRKEIRAPILEPKKPEQTALQP